jgi:hypothetical protein
MVFFLSLRASNPLSDFRQVFSGIGAVENCPELHERNALRSTSAVVLEKGAGLAGAHIQKRARPELLAGVQDLAMQVEVVAVHGDHVARAL